MATFEPVIVFYGSNKTISNTRLRIPITFIIATNEALLEELLTTDPDLSETCLQRYFLVLLDSVNNELLERLQNNHRIQTIYSRERIICQSSNEKKCRIIHKNLQQFTLILTADIVRFLTIEGEKQAKIERLHLTKIYYRQARILKEWTMSFARAEPCHILIIPLNTNEQNLFNAVEQIEKQCHQLGYPSVIIRTLDDYIPSSNENKQILLPYSQILFEHENPHCIRDFIRRLCPIRLYLYGNNELISSEWSKLLINHETNLMDDEDNWCAFIENEEIENEIKWNIGTMFGEKWKIKRLTPINLIDLNQNLRFQSALHRAFKTFDHRQFEITTEIYDWYDKCIFNGYLQIEPKLTIEQENKRQIKLQIIHSTYSQCKITRPSCFKYYPNYSCQTPSFIWLDEFVHSLNDYLEQIIEPYKWQFFSNTIQCLSFIENQIRQRKQIFFVLTGSFACQLFSTAYDLLSTLQFIYIYCSQIDLHYTWTGEYNQIRGVFNELKLLGEYIKEDLQYNPLNPIEQRINIDQTLVSIPIVVFNRDQADLFISHQRTIDTILCSPCTSETRLEMIEEFRRIYHDDENNLLQIEDFDQNYHSNNALQWYTRNTFLYRTINQALRTSNVELMFKLRYILIDLYVQLQHISSSNRIFHFHTSNQIKFYRGQRMFQHEYQYFQQLIGQIISINTFLSTTTSLQVALTFAEQHTDVDDMISIVFCIETDSEIVNKRPYGNISNLSAYYDEEEILFSMGSIFCVESIQNLSQNEQIPIIYLSLIDQKIISDKI